jgi:LPXTG-motif cell wall-anchored protein
MLRKTRYLLLGIIILLALALPTAVMATPPVATSPVFLQNTGPVPPSGYQWHFVLNGLENPSAGTPTLNILWDNGEWSDPIMGEVNNKTCFFYVPVYGDHIPVFVTENPTTSNCTYADVPGLSTGNLVISAPTPTNPVPEVPALALLGLGLVGVAGFIFVKKRGNKATVK